VTWIILSVLVVVPVVFWLLFGWQPLWRSLGREDFGRLLYSLLILREDGGSLHVEHRESDVAFDFFRGRGSTANGATIVLKIPRAPWSVTRKDELREALVSNLYDVKLIDDPDAQGVAEIEIPVEDIWEKWSGATAARAAHLVLETVGIRRDAKFKLSLRGESSTRWLDRERQLRGSGRRV